jgi:hypothetical protein
MLPGDGRVSTKLFDYRRAGDERHQIRARRAEQGSLAATVFRDAEEEGFDTHSSGTVDGIFEATRHVAGEQPPAAIETDRADWLVIKTELRDQRCGQTVISESRRFRRPF